MWPLRIERFIEAIIARIGAIQSTLRDEVNNEEHARNRAQEVADEERRGEWSRRIHERHVHKRAESEEREHKRKAYYQQSFLVLFTGFALLINTVVAVFMLLQWHEMTKATRASQEATEISAGALNENQRQFRKTLEQMVLQNDAAKKSSGAAERAAGVADQTLHISERAYLHIGDPLVRFDKKAIYIPIENSGHIPSGALHLIVHVQAVTKNANDQGMSDQSNWIDRSMPSLVHLTTSQGIGFDPDLLRVGRQWFSLGIEIEYNDGFKNTPTRTEEATFCSTFSNDAGFALGSCLASNTLELLKKADHYPDLKYRISEYQYQDPEGMTRQIILPR